MPVDACRLPATDQRGVQRPQGAACDLGAVEMEVDDRFVFGGFFAPVHNPPTVNVVRAGRPIPVKFSLGGNQGLAIFAAGYPVSRPVACDGSAPLAPLEDTGSMGGSSLQYDPATDTYTYMWKTDKAWAGTCRSLLVGLTDGTEHLALFRFK